ncbi:MAG TPA: Gfo/Idh/MocA family oxidoreductase [Terriglobales bacterium]|nr:Gfo/Idh/MocA family oxidoreductase [Terriglobales bacterium]
MNKLRMAVIGTGFWGKNHARVLSQLDSGQLICVCDLDEKSAKRVATEFHVPYCTNPDDVFSRSDVDAVTICTPTVTHYQIASHALRAGKHTLVEKPMTNTTSEGRELLNLAKKQNLRLMPGHIERFNPAVDRLKTLLDEKKLGTVTLFHARRVGRWPERIGDVGVVRDTAIHDIDLARYIFKDEVNSVHARIGSVRHTKEDYAEIMLQFGGGGTAFIDANWLTPRKTRVLIVTGSEALVEIDYISQEVSIEDASQLVKPTLEKKEPLKVELSHFTESVSEKKPFKVNGQDGLKAVEICEAVLHSGTMGQTIPLTT